MTTHGTEGKIQSIRPSPLTMPTPCKHPIVKVVAREEDAEFVECQQCGEVFDSAEYEDMALEEQEQMQHTGDDSNEA